MQSRVLAVACCGALAAACLVSNATNVFAAKKAPKKPVISVTASKFQPDAQAVELFEALEAGQIQARVLPKNEFEAKVLIENKTDEPLNVKFPKAVIAAPILAQFGGMGGMGGMGGGMGGMGMGGMGGGMGGMGGGMGGGQMMGGGMGGGMGGMGGGMGGMGGMGMGGMGGGGMGGGFFSVPPEKIVSVQLNTVCLEHGKPEPHLGMRYKLVPIAAVTEDPVATELLTLIGTGKMNRAAAQAAAWHLANQMSWQQLASKEQEHIGGLAPTPYFSRQELFGAQQILALAQERAERNEDGKEKLEQPVKATPRTARVSQAK